MLVSWLIFGIIIFICLLPLFLTIIFLFWSVYLLDRIHQKWKTYKNALMYLQQGDNDSVQQLLAYDSKTEFVKFVFLFFMNFVEWLGFLSGFIGIVSRLIQEFQIKSGTYQSDNIAGNSKIETKLFDIQNIFYAPNIFFVLSIILVASLCMYLAERFAKQSWIKSTKIPYLICSLLVCEILAQILGSFCITHIIGMWCEKFLLIISLLIAFKHYRKLMMIINWSILDLKISKNYLLLEKQVKMKQFSSKVSTLVCIGAILLITAQIMETISLTLLIITRVNTFTSLLYLSLCETSHFVIPQMHLIFTIFHLIDLIFSVLGALILTIPYIGYGLFTMCVIMWRLVRGKTGFKTHFHNDLRTSLI